MGVQKPEKSKAPAPTMDQKIFQTAISDPCCPPAGAVTAPGTVADAPDSALGGDAMGHIRTPGGH